MKADDPIAVLVNEYNSLADQLEAIGNPSPTPAVRRMGPEGSWTNNALKSAQEYGEQLQPSGDIEVPLPRHRPTRRYPNDQR